MKRAHPYRRRLVIFAGTLGLMAAACEAKPAASPVKEAPEPASALAREQWTSPPMPFGISMGSMVGRIAYPASGLTDEAFRQAVILDPQGFGLVKVPRPHDWLSTYVVLAAPKEGVCAVTGQSDPLDISPDLEAAVKGRSTYDLMKDQLEAIYGQSEPITNSIPVRGWNGTPDLLKGRVWLRQNLPAPLIGLSLALRPLKKDERAHDLGFLVVQFEFANYDRCKAEVTSHMASPFK
jgi:hypothetical protein